MVGRILFVGDGTILLHSSNSGVVSIWNTTTAQLKSHCAGDLLGISRDSATFLTYAGEEVYSWDTLTGNPVNLSTIGPEQYDLYQRTICHSGSGSLTLHLRDGFNSFPPKSLKLSLPTPTPQPSFDSIKILPNNQHLLAVISGEEFGQSWARGLCVDIYSGQVRYTFPVHRFSSPNFNVSEPHKVFATSDGNASFTLRSFAGGALRTVSTEGSGSDVVGINPLNMWLVATNIHGGQLKYLIHYLNIEHLIQENKRIYRGKIERIIEETGRIKQLRFHPNGVYLATLLYNQEIHLWHVQSGELLATLQPDLQVQQTGRRYRAPSSQMYQPAARQVIGPDAEAQKSWWQFWKK